MNIDTISAFDKIVSEKNSVVVVHFWAEWAPQCVQMNEVIDELAKVHPYVKFLKVLAEEVSETSERYDISAVPTFVLFKNGSVVDRVNGANAGDLSKKVDALAQSASTTITAPVLPPSANISPQDLNSRLKSLTTAAPVMLFMKGSPAEPKCGFSRKIIAILNDNNVKFSSFDILTDEAVRQGLKEFSQWPTYPQLYVNGELIGGLDIVEAMVASGELQAVIPKVSSKDQLDAKLQALIKQSKVMIFIKGTPEAPRCGFTKQLLAILQEDSIGFGYYDILGDSEVREGLKVFSNWPTYPQLYVNGELIGGLDIIKELRASGEFISTVNA